MSSQNSCHELPSCTISRVQVPVSLKRHFPPLLSTGEKRRVGSGCFSKRKHQHRCTDAPFLALKTNLLLCWVVKLYSEVFLLHSVNQKDYQNILFQAKDSWAPKTNY